MRNISKVNYKLDLQNLLKEVKKNEGDCQKMLKSEKNLKEAMARKAAKILMDIKETEEELMVKQLIYLGKDKSNIR